MLPAALPDAPTNRRELMRRALPFVATVVLALALAAYGPAANLDVGVALVSLVGFVVTGALILGAPLRRLPDWFPLVTTGVFCVSVALLRDASGDEGAGILSLLLLAIGWQALYGRRRDLIATVALAAVVMVIPLVLIGQPDYPASHWKVAVLLTAVGAVLGSVVQHLVAAVRQERNVLARLADVAGAGVTEQEVAPRICDAARALTGADVAILGARRKGRVVALATSGTDIAALSEVADRDDPDPLPATIQAALETGVLQEVADVNEGVVASIRLSRAIGVRAWAHQPTVRVRGTVSGVLSVGWSEPGRRLTAQERTALLLLGAEAAASLERAALVSRLEAEASHDPLTGLANRRTWDEALGREVARAGRSVSSLSVALIDLDRFKAYNDAHGHLAGDELLQHAAERWSSRLRAGDLLARWGGEEFTVLMPDTAAEHARGVVQRLLDATPAEQTFSAGLVTATGPTTVEDLMAAVDVALYRAKADGRNRIEVAPPITHPPVDRPRSTHADSAPSPAPSAEPPPATDGPSPAGPERPTATHT